MFWTYSKFINFDKTLSLLIKQPEIIYLTLVGRGWVDRDHTFYVDHPKTLWKTKNDFLKVDDELGEVMEFET